MSSIGKPAAAEDFDDIEERTIPMSKVSASIKKKQRRSDKSDNPKSPLQATIRTRQMSDSGYDSVSHAGSINIANDPNELRPMTIMGVKSSDMHEQKKWNTKPTSNEKPLQPSSSIKPHKKVTYIKGKTASTSDETVDEPTRKKGASSRPNTPVTVNTSRPPITHSNKKPISKTLPLQIQQFPILHHPLASDRYQFHPQVPSMNHPQSLYTQSQQPPFPNMADRFGNPVPTGLSSPQILSQSPEMHQRQARFDVTSSYTHGDGLCCQQTMNRLNVGYNPRPTRSHSTPHSTPHATRGALKNYESSDSEDSRSMSQSDVVSIVEPTYLCAPAPSPPPSHRPQSQRSQTARHETKGSKPIGIDRVRQLHESAGSYMGDDNEVPVAIQQELEQLRLINGLLLKNVAHTTAYTAKSRSSTEEWRSSSSQTTKARSNTGDKQNVTVEFPGDSKTIINGAEYVFPRGARMILPNNNDTHGNYVSESQCQSNGSDRHRYERVGGIDYLQHPLATPMHRPEYRRVHTTDYVFPRPPPEHLISRFDDHSRGAYKHESRDDLYPEGVKREIRTEYEYFTDPIVPMAPPLIRAYNGRHDPRYGSQGYY